jgi:hypothetical protein
MHSGDRFGLSEDIFGMRVTHHMGSSPLVAPPVCKVVFAATKMCKLVMYDGYECSIPFSGTGNEAEGYFSEPITLVLGHNEIVCDFGNSIKTVTRFTTEVVGNYLVAIDIDIAEIDDIPPAVKAYNLTNLLPLTSATVAFTDAYVPPKYVTPVVTPAVTPAAAKNNSLNIVPVALAAIAAYFAFQE